MTSSPIRSAPIIYPPSPVERGKRSNLINRVVDWLQSNEISNLKKIWFIESAAIFILTIGFLSGKPLLFFGSVTLISVAPGHREAEEIILKDQDEIPKGELQNFGFSEVATLGSPSQPMLKEEIYLDPTEEKEYIPLVDVHLQSVPDDIKEAFGGHLSYVRFPTLPLDHRNEIFTLSSKPERLTHPMMKNSPKSTVQFIAMKVRHKETSQNRIVYVFKFQNESQWQYTNLSDLSDNITPHSLNEIRLLREGKHLHYVMATQEDL